MTAHHSCTLGFSPRLPVSVCGTVWIRTLVRGFSWQHGYGQLACPKARFPITPQGLQPDGFACPAPLRASTTISTRWLTFTSASPLTIKRPSPSAGMFYLLPITYAVRPRLRGRLTPGGLAFPGNPWTFGAQGSHLRYRYSCRHDHFRVVQQPLRATFATQSVRIARPAFTAVRHGTLPYRYPANTEYS